MILSVASNLREGGCLVFEMSNDRPTPEQFLAAFPPDIQALAEAAMVAAARTRG